MLIIRRFHPSHGTLGTVGSDGRFSFWDKDGRTKLKNSEALDQPISCCAFNSNGQIFAYAVSYDWSKVSYDWSTTATGRYSPTPSAMIGPR